MTLPSPQTMFTYARILEKQHTPIAEAACEALRVCAQAALPNLVGCLHPHACKKLGWCRDPGLCNHKGPL